MFFAHALADSTLRCAVARCLIGKFYRDEYPKNHAARYVRWAVRHMCPRRFFDRYCGGLDVILDAVQICNDRVGARILQLACGYYAPEAVTESLSFNHIRSHYWGRNRCINALKSAGVNFPTGFRLIHSDGRADTLHAVCLTIAGRGRVKKTKRIKGETELVYLQRYIRELLKVIEKQQIRPRAVAYLDHTDWARPEN